MKKVLSIGVIAVISLAIGIIGTVGVSSVISRDTSGLSPSVVFDRIVQKNELVGASQEYSIIDKVSSTNKLLDWDIPFTTNSFWYRYVGTIKAGVNLETAEFQQEDGLVSRVVTIALDQPYIISNTPDMTRSGVLEENNNIFNPIKIKDSDDFQRQCIELSESQAIENGLLDETRTNIEQDLSDLFYAALSDTYSIKIVWRDAQ